jgi:hypothetical protein
MLGVLNQVTGWIISIGQFGKALHRLIYLSIVSFEIVVRHSIGLSNPSDVMLRKLMVCSSVQGGGKRD